VRKEGLAEALLQAFANSNWN